MTTNRSVAARLLAIGITILAAAGIARAASFTAGNIVVYRIGTGAAPLAGSATAVFLDEYTPAGALVQSIAMPTAAAGLQRALTTNGTSTAEGLMTRSQDGAYLLVPGYDAIPGAAVPAAAANRVVGRVDNLGNVDTSTTEAGTSGNMRGAASTNGTAIWLSTSAAGVRATTFGATTAATQLSTTVTNIRSVNIFGGQIYISSASGTFQGISTIGSGTPTTSGQTTTILPGFPTAAGPSSHEFFFADLTAAVAGVDTVYVADDRASPNGGIQKWSFDGTTWTLTSTTILAGARGLAGSVSGTTVTLFVADASSLRTVTDTAGYNAAQNGATIGTVIASAGTNKAFRGLAMAPQSIAGPPPTVSSIIRASASPTNAASVNYTVTFSQSVTGVDATDFTFSLSGVTGASVTGVSGSGTTYTVTVNTGTGSGTLRLDVTDNDSIVNGSSTPLGGAGAGNGNFTTGEVYTIDKTAPSATSINRASTNPTNASSVNFTVTFSEAVVGVAAGNFTPAMTGVTGASVGTPTTSNNIAWTVPVNTGSGDGTLGLDLTSTSGITDAVGNPLAGTHASDQTYTIDKTPPAVLSIIRVNGSPTAAATVDYTVTFTEPVLNVDTADFTVTATGVTGTGVTNVTGSGATRTVTVSIRGRMRRRSNASRFARIVDSAPAPPAM